MFALVMLFTAVVQAPATDSQGLIFLDARRAGYHVWRLGRSDGYKETKLTDLRWRVHAQAGRGAIKDLALLSTLYRSAIIAKAAGHSRFYPIKLEIGNQLASHYVVSNQVYGQNVYSTIVLHDNAASPPPCEAAPKWAENCRDQSADEVIATIGPLLGQDAAAAAIEIETARGKYYARVAANPSR